MIEVKSYARNPFEVSGVQVTTENMEEVAIWCGGKVRKDHIKVDVKNPLTPRQALAYPGNWVLYGSSGFKVYSNKAFVNNFTELDKTSRISEESVAVLAEALSAQVISESE